MSPDRLSATFAALADPRGARSSRVSPRETSVLKLAEPFEISLPCSLETPESAGTRGPDRARPRGAVAALPAPGQSAQGHRRLVEYYRRHWEESFDKLDRYLKELQHKKQGE